MLTVLNKHIKDIQYSRLILYAQLRCDAFSICIPDLYTKMSSSTRSEEFLQYRKNIARIYEFSMPQLIKSYVSNDYFMHHRDSYQEIEIYALNKGDCSTDFLFNSHDLFKWQYPDLPEDLCLFSNGKCWLTIAAHEKQCWIYDAGQVERDILKKVIGLKFNDDGKEDANAPLML